MLGIAEREEMRSGTDSVHFIIRNKGWTAHLLQCWGSNPYSQAATADSGNHFTGGITTQDQAACAGVFLHGAAQSMLCIFRQAVHLC